MNSDKHQVIDCFIKLYYGPLIRISYEAVQKQIRFLVNVWTPDWKLEFVSSNVDSNRSFEKLVDLDRSFEELVDFDTQL